MAVAGKTGEACARRKDAEHARSLSDDQSSAWQTLDRAIEANAWPLSKLLLDRGE
jgi:hypothetical protein